MLGVGAKIFRIAGLVIVYGAFAGVVYGVIYWVILKQGLTDAVKPFVCHILEVL